MAVYPGLSSALILGAAPGNSVVFGCWLRTSTVAASSEFILQHLGLMSSNAPLELSGGSPCPPKIVPPSFTGTCRDKGKGQGTREKGQGGGVQAAMHDRLGIWLVYCCVSL